ncbi:tetratricopeptide repeat protein [Streptomyces anulatus]|uniref:tetratricopeptide repeat protein n=1 Tax=Streptomyces anulatus TaxID=1892 RepID=UPI00341BF0D6
MPDGIEGSLFERLERLAAFRRDRMAGKPSDRQLAMRAQVSPTTVGAWLRGHSFPQQLDLLLAVIGEIRSAAAKARLLDRSAVALMDEEGWRHSYRDELERRASQTREAVIQAQARDLLQVISDRGPGTSISELNPFDLEVHQAIEVPDPKQIDLPLLPKYVEREHDTLLGEIVREAIGGDSRFVVLVGGSSTGKTRACWEAIQALPADWKCWHPIHPTHCDAILADAENIEPRTAVWLNEAQHYLLTPGADKGERVAASIREILRDPRRRPVLFLGTMWPENWETLTTTCDPGDRDPHVQSRALLTGRNLEVPSTFSGRDWENLYASTHSDPRLAQAAENAEQGEITQYLAGVPALLNRYRAAPDAARAVIEAAIDARRLGHGSALSAEFLEAAAEAYLTDQQWDLLQKGWFQKALTYASKPLRGTRGPLILIRSRRNEPLTQHPCYRLADYLEQQGNRARSLAIVPSLLWSSLVEYADRSSYIVLARRAEAKGLLRIAVDLYCAAARDGELDGVAGVAHLLRESGRNEEALPWHQCAGKAGQGFSACEAAAILEKMGRQEEALDWYRLAHELGYNLAASYISGVLRDLGRADEAYLWDREVLKGGNILPTWSSNEMREEMLTAGITQEEVLWSQAIGESDGTIALTCITQVTGSIGRSEMTQSWSLTISSPSVDPDEMPGPNVAQQQASLAGIPQDVWAEETCSLLWRKYDTGGTREVNLWTSELLQTPDVAEEAIEWLEARIEHGYSPHVFALVQMMREAGGFDTVIHRLQGNCACTPDARRATAQVMRDFNMLDQALAWLMEMRDEESYAGSALLIGADLLREASRVEEALEWYEQAIKAGDDQALHHCCDMFRDLGQSGRCMNWLTGLAGDGNLQAGAKIIDLLCGVGRTDEAYEWCMRIVRSSQGLNHRYAESLLAKAGRVGDAENVRRYGWEPDGSIAKPWEAPPLVQNVRTANAPSSD